MAKFKKANSKTVVTVLKNIITQCEKDAHYAAMYAEELNILLDDLCGQDAFGTECQSDPRGDHRD